MSDSSEDQHKDHFDDSNAQSVESEVSDSEEESKGGLFDKPVIQSGHRERKKTERLEVKFNMVKSKNVSSEGRGDKLGDSPKIDFNLSKAKIENLKVLHKVLFNRLGTNSEIKKNIRKFSGFIFAEDSQEYERKKASLEKLPMRALKDMCLKLDIERSGVKENIFNRLMSFLMKPEVSTKAIKKPKSNPSTSKIKKKSSVSRKKSTDHVSSNDEDDASLSANESEEETEDKKSINEDDSDDEKNGKSDEDNITFSRTSARKVKKSIIDRGSSAENFSDSDWDSSSKKKTKKASKVKSTKKKAQSVDVSDDSSNDETIKSTSQKKKSVSKKRKTVAKYDGSSDEESTKKKAQSVDVSDDSSNDETIKSTSQKKKSVSKKRKTVAKYDESSDEESTKKKAQSVDVSDDSSNDETIKSTSKKKKSVSKKIKSVAKYDESSDEESDFTAEKSAKRKRIIKKSDDENCEKSDKITKQDSDEARTTEFSESTKTSSENDSKLNGKMNESVTKKDGVIESQKSKKVKDVPKEFESSDDEPLIKKIPPTNEELQEKIKGILKGANLADTTMKSVCKQVFDKYPGFDLTDRKSFIKATVTELIS